MEELTATYSPDDNKLRLYASGKLPPELYEKLKAAGFKWAPKQELFVAPMWTPQRADLLEELCGEIGDEDASLADRAAIRSERFEDYSDKRATEAARAQEQVEALTNGIPLGQPILIGHHSEKHARKQAEKIENGMRSAVRLWETSEYWARRAAGALRHAQYKERPDVRARRIKGIEADKRKAEKNKAEAENWLKLWEACALETDEAKKLEKAKAIAGYCHLHMPRKEGDRPDFNQNPSAYGVLNNSYPNLYAPRTVAEVIEVARKTYPRQIAWQERWIAHYNNRLVYERAMLQEQGGTASDQIKPEKGGACKCWASHRGGYSYIVKVNKVSVTVLDNWGNGGGNFTRNIPFDKLTALLTAEQVGAARTDGRLLEFPDKTGFVLTDSVTPIAPKVEPKEDKASAMREQLKAGIQVVSANQLFPTPPELAERMVLEAEIQPGDSVLDPSAGTGSILRAIVDDGNARAIVAVEINRDLSEALRREFPLSFIHCRDFLEYQRDYPVDRIIMNPPFENAVDIKHIKHAVSMLKPGGKLVALCAAGPRQTEQLKPIADSWEVLPAGTFKESGTMVNVALMTYTRKA